MIQVTCGQARSARTELNQAKSFMHAFIVLLRLAAGLVGVVCWTIIGIPLSLGRAVLLIASCPLVLALQIASRDERAIQATWKDLQATPDLVLEGYREVFRLFRVADPESRTRER